MSIMLVEDDLNLQTTVKFMLQEIGMLDVKVFGNGDDALRFFDDGADSVQLIICDWNMPQKTGIEFLREVRQSHPDLPFLLITGRSDQGSVLTAKEAHVTDYLRKPFSLDELKSKLSSIELRTTRVRTLLSHIEKGETPANGG